ncbi:MAG: ABC transporter permease subunit, partial [Firmicutes bacterium]|nr:ABC transporter permease subunit [Bacillota bacterium]
SSYAEAVYVDGGGEYTVLFRIMLPVALPPMSALFIMACIGAWNDYMTVILYLPSYPTIASGLYEIQYLFERDARLPLYFAALIISIIPVLTLFALFSGKIMKNMTVGGLKG